LPSREVEVAERNAGEAEAALAKAPVQLTLAAAISPPTALLRITVQLKSSAATKAVVVLAAAKPAPVTVTSKATPKLPTFMLKVIVGSVMTGAAAMRITILTALGNTDVSAAKLAATTFIASKEEAGTVSGSAAFSGASRRTTMTTAAIGCGTATTS